MDWASVKDVVAKDAPLLGTLVGGPAGAAIGGLISSALGCANTPDDVKVALATNPDAAVKLRQIEADHDVAVKQLVLAQAANDTAADTARIQAVNATMQGEAKSDHWPTYSWRPYNGFIFGTTFLGVYLVLPLCKLPVPIIPTEAWIAIGAILGVASWFRGSAQANPTIPTDNRG